MLLNDSNVSVDYAVMVDGKIIFKTSSSGSGTVAKQIVAENYKEQLPEDVRARAVVVPVTNTGKQVLFG